MCQEGDALSPARAAGLEPGDEIVSFNGQRVSSWDQLSDRIHGNLDGAMALEVIRDGERVVLQQAHTVAMERDLSAEGTAQRRLVGFLGVRPESHEVVTRLDPFSTLLHMGEMTAHAVSSVVDLPGRVLNVALAITGQEQRRQDGPMSVIGGSRLAGEVAASRAAGLDVGGKAALLGMVVGSFNLFIGVFNLIPLLPLDGGHIAGAAWEGARRRLARLLRVPTPVTSTSPGSCRSPTARLRAAVDERGAHGRRPRGATLIWPVTALDQTTQRPRKDQHLTRTTRTRPHQARTRPATAQRPTSNSPRTAPGRKQHHDRPRRDP